MPRLCVTLVCRTEGNDCHTAALVYTDTLTPPTLRWAHAAMLRRRGWLLFVSCNTCGCSWFVQRYHALPLLLLAAVLTTHPNPLHPSRRSSSPVKKMWQPVILKNTIAPPFFKMVQNLDLRYVLLDADGLNQNSSRIQHNKRCEPHLFNFTGLLQRCHSLRPSSPCCSPTNKT